MEGIASTAAMQVARRDWETQLDDPQVAGKIGETGVIHQSMTPA